MLFTCSVFLFRDPATTEIYTLSLHDALPISVRFAPLLIDSFWRSTPFLERDVVRSTLFAREKAWKDRKSTRLNSSHRCISYAVFCLKKKKEGENVAQEQISTELQQTTHGRQT